MTTFLIATRNEHKIQEIRAILSDRFHYLTLRDFPGAPSVVEDADTFTGNATKKAVELAHWLACNTTKLPATTTSLSVLADDSGLEVDALQGAPGVHSARFAAENGNDGNAPDADNNAKLLRLLKNVPLEGRTARFRCVIALTPVTVAVDRNSSPVCALDQAEFETEIFEGTCEGRIGLAPSGGHGFGYDPLFTPKGYQQTFAELGEAEKNKLSHRAHALAKLRLRLGIVAKP